MQKLRIMLPFRAGQLKRYTTNTDLYALSDGFDHNDLDALFEDNSLSAKKNQEAVQSEPKTKMLGKMATTQPNSKNTKRHKRWWHELEDVDPISLEPLAELKYPPFQLKSSNDSSNESVAHMCWLWL